MTLYLNYKKYKKYTFLLVNELSECMGLVLDHENRYISEACQHKVVKTFELKNKFDLLEIDK